LPAPPLPPTLRGRLVWDVDATSREASVPSATSSVSPSCRSRGTGVGSDSRGATTSSGDLPASRSLRICRTRVPRSSVSSSRLELRDAPHPDLRSQPMAHNGMAPPKGGECLFRFSSGPNHADQTRACDRFRRPSRPLSPSRTRCPDRSPRVPAPDRSPAAGGSSISQFACVIQLAAQPAARLTICWVKPLG